MENLPSVGAKNGIGCNNTSTSTYLNNEIENSKPLKRGLEVYHEIIPSNNSNMNRNVNNMNCSKVPT